jgi:hypothetical protein
VSILSQLTFTRLPVQLAPNGERRTPQVKPSEIQSKPRGKQLTPIDFDY